MANPYCRLTSVTSSELGTSHVALTWELLDGVTRYRTLVSLHSWSASTQTPAEGLLWFIAFSITALMELFTGTSTRRRGPGSS